MKKFQLFCIFILSTACHKKLKPLLPESRVQVTSPKDEIIEEEITTDAKLTNKKTVSIQNMQLQSHSQPKPQPQPQPQTQAQVEQKNFNKEETKVNIIPFEMPKANSFSLKILTNEEIGFYDAEIFISKEKTHPNWRFILKRTAYSQNKTTSTEAVLDDENEFRFVDKKIKSGSLLKYQVFLDQNSQAILIDEFKIDAPKDLELKGKLDLSEAESLLKEFKKGQKYEISGRLFLNHLDLHTMGKRLELKTKSLISKQSRIHSFPHTARAPLNKAGRAAQTIIIQSEEASGRLEISNHGEAGGHGQKGRDGINGKAGKNGKDSLVSQEYYTPGRDGGFQSRVVCDQEASNGSAGSSGQNGSDGKNGQNGGNGGHVFIKITELKNLHIDVSAEGALAGQGGQAGLGGTGGAGGKAGKKLHPCKYTAKNGLKGANGKDGKKGVNGMKGHTGNIHYD